MVNQSRRALILILIGVTLGVACAKNTSQDWSELLPVLKENDLSASPVKDDNEVAEVELSDAKLYRPIAGTTLFLESPSPTSDSRDMRPRYWLRVEDYVTSDAAATRAAEYNTVGTYDRLGKAYRKSDGYVSKITVRLWAVARGKRVYALTTNANLFGLIEKPKALRKSIEALPEL